MLFFFQAVSSSNLTLEDSVSIRSISVDETPPPQDLEPVEELPQPDTFVERRDSEQSTESRNSGDSGSDNREYDESASESGNSVVKTKLPPGKVSHSIQRLIPKY